MRYYCQAGSAASDALYLTLRHLISVPSRCPHCSLITAGYYRTGKTGTCSSTKYCSYIGYYYTGCTKCSQTTEYGYRSEGYSPYSGYYYYYSPGYTYYSYVRGRSVVNSTCRRT